MASVHDRLDFLEETITRIFKKSEVSAHDQACLLVYELEAIRLEIRQIMSSFEQIAAGAKAAAEAARRGNT